MSNELPSNDQPAKTAATASETGRRTPAWRRSVITLVASVALLGVGVAAGASATRLMVRHEAQPLMPPIAISAMTDGSVAAVKGKVTEIYGNKFVVEDQTGRTLVETGRAGKGGSLVTRDEILTVQGRFDDGFMRGSMIVHADGRTDILRGPDGGGRHESKDWFRKP
jgi:hypothetical protein